MVTHTGSFALRLASASPDPDGPPRFEVDAELRSRLGTYCPQVLNSGGQTPVPGVPFWSLDAWAEGEHPEPGEVPAAAAEELGAALSRLHALPCTGYGRLRDGRGELRGEARGFLAGLESRLERSFARDGNWESFPLAKAAPALLPLVQAVEPELRARLDAAAKQKGVVLHGDLHERQLLVQAGALSALLDFGDAWVGPAAFDLAAYAYFHGWAALPGVLAGYSAPPEPREVELFSLLLAFHHISRAYTLERPSRRSFAVRHLKLTFARLGLEAA